MSDIEYIEESERTTLRFSQEQYAEIPSLLKRILAGDQEAETAFWALVDPRDANGERLETGMLRHLYALAEAKVTDKEKLPSDREAVLDKVAGMAIARLRSRGFQSWRPLATYIPSCITYAAEGREIGSKPTHVFGDSSKQIKQVMDRISAGERDAEADFITLINPCDEQGRRVKDSQTSRIHDLIKADMLGTAQVDEDTVETIIDDSVLAVIIALRKAPCQNWGQAATKLRNALIWRYEKYQSHSGRETGELNEGETARLQQQGKLTPLADRFEETIETALHGEEIVRKIEDLPQRWAKILQLRFVSE